MTHQPMQTSAHPLHSTDTAYIDRSADTPIALPTIIIIIVLNTTHNNPQLIVATVLLYGGGLAGIGVLYRSYAPSARCSLHIGFITLTLLLGIAYTAISARGRAHARMTD